MSEDTVPRDAPVTPCPVSVGLDSLPIVSPFVVVVPVPCHLLLILSGLSPAQLFPRQRRNSDASLGTKVGAGTRTLVTASKLRYIIMFREQTRFSTVWKRCDIYDLSIYLYIL